MPLLFFTSEEKNMAIAKRDPRVAVAPQYLAERRRQRRPQHKFNLKMLPYQIQPFLLAPVLPGETLTSMMLQSQVWSDPLTARMKNIGWWLQYNFFYVRHRDLPSDVRTILAEMLIKPDEVDVSPLERGSQSYPLYTYAGGMNWTEMCLEHIVSEFFRDDGEDWDDFTLDGLPAAQIYGQGTADAFERLTLAPEYEDRRVDLIDAEGHLYANDLSTMFGHWNALRDAGLTDMDYQDWMKTYGSTVREDEESPNLHRAEDLWSIREFTYPTNTVEPSNGVPAVAAGWRMAKNGGKRVFCDEPGFIFGVTYVRPKVYLRAQKGSVAGLMGDVRAWLPALLHDQRDLGHVMIDGTGGPLPNVFDDGEEGFESYWLDLRDLLLYGDQYVNFDPADDVPFLDLPAADATRRYAAETEVKAMFANAETGKFESDGLVSLSILGRQTASQSGLVLGRS